MSTKFEAPQSKMEVGVVVGRIVRNGIETVHDLALDWYFSYWQDKDRGERSVSEGSVNVPHILTKTYSSLSKRKVYEPYYNIIVSIFIYCICGAFMILTRYKESTFNNADVSEILNSVTFKVASASLVMCTIPIIIEMVLDLVFTWLYQHSMAFINPFKIIRLALTSGACITGLQLVCIHRSRALFFTYGNQSAILLWCACTSGTIVACVLGSALTMVKPKLCPFYITTTISTLAAVFELLKFFHYMETGIFVRTVYYFRLLFLFGVVVIIAHWARQVFLKTVVWTNNCFAAIIYMAIGITFTIAQMIAQLRTRSTISLFDQLTETKIATYLFVLVFCVIVMNLVPQRLARIHALELKDHVIETKRAYIRFISHEMRTPLNIVFMGLKLCIDQIPPDTISIIEKERLTTLSEIATACEAALNILNELLLLDTVENGLLEINKQPVKAKAMVRASVNMFAVQVREKNICLKTQGLGGAYERQESQLTSKSLTEEDEIMMDENKVQQVIRNVISNAIKFTPVGGDITVTLSFVKNLPSENEEETLSLRNALPSSNARKSKVIVASTVPLNAANTPTNIDNSGPPAGTQSKQSLSGNTASSQYELSTNGHMMIQITDSGAGMTEEEQKKLFKEIVQFRPEVLQNGGGSGLGMWISNSIVQLHEGTISVKSEGIGKGSTFTITFPMKRNVKALERAYSRLRFSQQQSSLKQEEKSVQESPKSKPTAQHFDFKLSPVDDVKCDNKVEVIPVQDLSQPLQLLLVDDVRMNRRILNQMLTRKGHHCDEAEDGLIALNMIKSLGDDIHKYDAILMDYMMPNMDGPTATSEIRKLGYMKPIIGVTGHALKNDQDYFMSCGATCIFTKPVEVDAIQKIFHDHLWK